MRFRPAGGHELMYRHMTEPFQELLFHKQYPPRTRQYRDEARSDNAV
uniref:Uncharacterized protein n=1 Tax=Escherichia coli TaxID=562 RepID=A0A6G6ALL5_ECOLX|nr:hypothetical protein [Escherichia coli]